MTGAGARLRRAARLALLLAGLGAASLAAVALLASGAAQSPETISTMLERAGGWGPVAFVVASALRPLLLLPAQAFSAAAGALWGPGIGSAVAVAGNWASLAVVVLLGRRLLRGPLSRWSGPRRDELEQVARRHDFLYGLVMALNPLLPTDLAIAAASGAGARSRQLLAGSLLGAAPQAASTALFGGALVGDQSIGLALSTAGVALSLVGGVWIARGIWRSLRPARPPLGLSAAVPGGTLDRRR